MDTSPKNPEPSAPFPVLDAPLDDEPLTFRDRWAIFKYKLGRRFSALLALILGGCGAHFNLPALPHENRVQWDHEPTVSVWDAELAPAAKAALADWGWGKFVGHCYEADICLRKVAWLPSPTLARAVWWDGRQACEIDVFLARQDIITHEIGHCFGLKHSEYRRSLMYGTTRAEGGPRFGRSIKHGDLESLKKIKKEVAIRARRL